MSDPIEAAKMGYSVGRLSGIKILFQHYVSFSAAKSAWDKRVARVILDKVFFDDRSGRLLRW